METIEQLNFNLHIQAPAEKVWQVLWNDATYRTWTTVFCEGSYAESEWKEGSKILFMAPNGSGMNSVIRKMIPVECMIFWHRGIVNNFIEEPVLSPDGNWGENATESNFLSEKNGGTELRVELNATERDKPYFLTTFPKALDVVKQLSEKI